MAQILKRCDCPRSKWSKCPHSWTVRWWGADGKQHEKSFKRNHALAAEHKKRVEAAKLSVHRGDPAPPGDPVTLESYARTWLEGLSAPPGTIRTYSSALRNHVLPQHGRRTLTEVAADREGMQALLRSVPPGMTRPVFIALRALLSEARASGRIDGDRLSGLRVEPARPADFTFPSFDQLSRLADGMRTLAPAIWIMRGCGLRPGEVLAVRGAADRPGGPGFAAGRLRISEQRLTSGELGPLKARRAGEFRDVPVPGYVLQAVAGLGTGYLFRVSGTTFRTWFRTAADNAGLKGFRAHDLRHIFASVALSSGVPITDVSRWLGHRSIEITYRTYSHFIPDSWDQARSALDAEYAKWSAS